MWCLMNAFSNTPISPRSRLSRKSRKFLKSFHMNAHQSVLWERTLTCLFLKIQKEIFEVIQPFLQERICECIVEQIISVPQSGTIRRSERHTTLSGAHLWCSRSTDCGRDRASYGGREHCPCFSRGRTACKSLRS